MDEILNGWFSEICPMWPGRALSIKIEETLYCKKSKYQQIDVFRTSNCGVMLVLDGIIQCTEEDEFAYQEMMTHVPMFAHPKPERVLVIGGGDGGILREIARHSVAKEIDICEIDGDVIDVSKKFLPSMAVGFDDPRVKVNIMDGNEFLKNKQNYYDVIIVDSSDPIGPGEVLFKEPFYVGLKGALRENGIIATQAESVFLHQDVVQNLMTIAQKLFPVSGYAHMMVPTYPGGNIGMCVASLGLEIKQSARFPDNELQKSLKYYTPEIHKSSFVLPRFAEKFMESI